MGRLIILSILVYSLFILSTTMAQDANCTYDSATTGYSFDLSPLMKTGGAANYQYLEADKGTWFINFCANATGTGCKTPGTACQYGSQITGVLPGVFTDLVNSVAGIPDDAQGVNYTYYGGDYCAGPKRNRQTSIYVICNTTADPGFISEVIEPTDPAMTCMYAIEFQSIYGCPGGGGGGIEVGWILIIILIIVVFLYLAVGVVYQWKKNHATGLELMPNHEFWREAPGLFKDGCLYTFRKITCKKIINHSKRVIKLFIV